MPGTYKVRVANDSLAGSHLKQPDDRVLVVNKSDFYVQDIKLVSESDPDTIALPVTPVDIANPALGDASNIRFADSKNKTRLTLHMTVKADVAVKMENNGKTLVIDLSQLNWRDDKSGGAKSAALTSAYHIENGKLYVELKRAAQIKSQRILPPSGKDKDYRLIINLYSKEVHR